MTSTLKGAKICPPLRGALQEVGKDVTYYIPAQFIPGLSGFLALAVYTRFLSPSEYGVYILTLNTISIVISITLGWIYNAVLRYHEFYKLNGKLIEFLSTTCVSLLLSILTVILTGTIVFFAFFDFQYSIFTFILVAILTFIAKSCFAYVISILRARRATLKYSLYASINSIGSIILGIVLILSFRPCPEVILLGIAISSLVIILIEGGKLLHEHHLKFSSTSLLIFKKCFSYGIPLIGVTFGSLVLSLSDRYILQYLKNSIEVGIYASGYDLVDKAIKITFSILLAASYPVIVQVFEQKGGEEVKKVLSKLLNIYILLFSPIILTIIIMAPEIVSLFLGRAFKGATVVIPWIAAGTFFLGMSQIIAQWLQLKENTKILLFFFIIAAVFNICLNFVLISKYGILGAAIATFVSYLLHLILCLSSCIHILAAFSWKSMSKVLLALCITYYSINWLQSNISPNRLLFFLQLCIGGICYIGSLAIFKEENLIKCLKNLFEK